MGRGITQLHNNTAWGNRMCPKSLCQHRLPSPWCHSVKFGLFLAGESSRGEYPPIFGGSALSFNTSAPSAPGPSPARALLRKPRRVTQVHAVPLCGCFFRLLSCRTRWVIRGKQQLRERGEFETEWTPRQKSSVCKGICFWQVGAKVGLRERSWWSAGMFLCNVIGETWWGAIKPRFDVFSLQTIQLLSPL